MYLGLGPTDVFGRERLEPLTRAGRPRAPILGTVPSGRESVFSFAGEWPKNDKLHREPGEPVARFALTSERNRAPSPWPHRVYGGCEALLSRPC